VTEEENLGLEDENFEEEVKRAIDSSYVEGAPGPEGFSFMFYQKFWPIIKKDFMAMIKGFEQGEINIAKINYAMIILIPKEDETRSLKKFRPISLINCSFMIFSKILNNRLEELCGRLLAPNQTAFVRGRYTLEIVVSAHEIIHEAVKSNQKGMVLKLDYEKAYDRVDMHFLEAMLVSRGFGSKWIKWVMSLVKNGSIVVRLNDENRSFSKLGKG
jgi:hypothetical protein